MLEGEMAIIKPEMMKSYIWLETADGSIQQVEQEVAMFSPMICHEVLQKGVGSSKNYAISLPQRVNPAMLSLIFDYCRFHQVPGRSNKERKIYDEKFIRMDTKRLCELTSAADSLQLKPLVDLTSRALARIVEGKSPEEIREIFHLPDDLTEEEKLEPLKNTMGDPRIRLLNRLYAKKRKELKEREKLKNIEVEERVDERSVDDLLSFINGRDPKVAKTCKSKKKNKKRKVHKNGKSNGTCGASKKDSHNLHSKQQSAEIVDESATSRGEVSNVLTMEDDIFTLKTEFEDGYIDDEIDPALKEMFDRFLHVVFYMAERAWSHAMEKRQLPDGPNARQRIYLIGRLRKAVKWATLFSTLSSIKTDSRTSLEAEAYASYMKGTLLFEQDQNWETALACFKNARAVYEELGKYGDLENQVLCRERVEELEPSIRYCLHKIGKSNLQTSELLQIGEMEGPALDLFKAKIEAAMEEARSKQAASLTEFNWLGYRFPVSNPKSRVSILKAQELEKDLQGPVAESLPAEKKLTIYDKLFTAYHDARTTIRSDLVSAGNAESVKDDLNGLDKAVGAVLGQRTIERNQLLVKIAKSKLKRKRDDKSEKVTRPEELVRLFDLLLQNVADLSDLISSGRDRKPEEIAFEEECQRKSLAFRAERCFYLAKSYSLAGKRVEAYALYCRARSLAEDALAKFQSIAKKDEGTIQELKTLSKECRANSCIEHATGIMEEEKAPENLSKKISNISLNDTAANKVEQYLLDKLDVYESAVGDSNTKTAPKIERFPPAFQSIPRNPIVLDLAYSCINFPVIENRMKKKGGFISRFFG